MKRRAFITGLIGTTLGLGAAGVTSAAPRVLGETLSSSLTLDNRGRGGDPYHKLLLHATVMATGMTEAEVRAQLQAGKSLQAVAESKGKTAADVIASARTTLKTRLDQEVKDGNITQAQADTRLADFDSKAPQLMQQTGDAGNGRGPKSGNGRGTKPGQNKNTDSGSTDG